MRKFQRIMVFLLVVCLVLTFVGCSNNGQKTATDTVATDDANADGDKVTFTATFLQNEWHGDPNEMEVFNKLEEMANVDVVWEVYPKAIWETKKNLILASETLPDVFYMNALTSADVTKYAAQGMLMELTDLINQNAPNLTKAFEEMPHFKAICVNPDDGKIYSVGRAAEREVKYTSSLMYIYKPWLDQLGFEVPETMDDFYNALKAFKTQDPNGNGENDEIPFSFNYDPTSPDNNFSINELFGAFGYVDAINQAAQHFIKDENGNIIYLPQQDEYKEAITFFSKCVQEGLWDKEAFTTKDISLLNAKGCSETPILGSFMAFDSTFVVPEERLSDYVILEPLTGPNGHKIWLYDAASNGNVNGTHFVMTRDAEGKEEAIMQWLNAHFDPDMSIQLFLGPEGTTIEKTDSGMYDYIPTPEGLTYSEFRYGNAPVHTPSIIKAEDWGKTIQVMAEDINKLSIAKEHYLPYSTQSSIFLIPNEEESDYLLKEGKDINDYVNKMAVKWMTEGGIEGEWDTYLEGLQSLGVEKYTELVNGIVERMQ